MTKYFQVIDSLDFYDTIDSKLKLLKAYHSNDTIYLKKTYSELANLLKLRKEFQKSQVCQEPGPLHSLKCEEAYRFRYSAAFCDKLVNMTISKMSNAINLDLYLFQINNGQTECKTLSHTTKQLDNKEWYLMLKDLYYTDFWGLKEDNGDQGYDGSNLYVEGYQSPINAFNGNYN
jgi:hypothetical protein